MIFSIYSKTFLHEPVVHPKSGATLILDQFTDTDTTALTAHTIAPTNTPAAAWTYIGGSVNYANILSNQVHSNAGNYLSVYSLDTGVADCDIVAEITSPTSDANTVGMTFRATDIDNYWRLQLDNNTSTISIYEVTSGVEVQRANAGGIPAPDGSTEAMRVILSGSAIIGSYAGSDLAYTSTVRQTVTKHGLYFYGSGPMVDEFQVTA